MKNSGIKYRAGNDPRVAALSVLKAVLQAGANTQEALDRQLKASVLVPADKALCTGLAYGVLRLHLRLNWFLGRKLARPDKLPAEMLLVLELAAYELAHLRIPEHASVNFAVDFLRHRFGAGLAGVGNAVLRSFQRTLKEEYENKDFYLECLGGRARGVSESGAEFLALFHSMPEWIVRLWQRSYGEKATLGYLEAGLRQAPAGVRVNLLRAGHEALLNELKQVPGAIFVPPAAIALPSSEGTALRARQDAGLLSRQSAAAYAVLAAMRPETWEQPVWDACAGRGGKSLALLERGVAVERMSDASAQRLEGFQREFQRLFPPELFPEAAEGRKIPPYPDVIRARAQEAASFAGKKGRGAFGSILLDVPCSGLGTLARRPEIRWRSSRENMAGLCAGQDELLEAAGAALKPGGRIVYMTCTLNPAENQERIEFFCQRHPGFKLLETWQSPPDSPLNEFFWAAQLRKRGFAPLFGAAEHISAACLSEKAGNGFFSSD